MVKVVKRSERNSNKKNRYKDGNWGEGNFFEGKYNLKIFLDNYYF